MPDATTPRAEDTFIRGYRQLALETPARPRDVLLRSLEKRLGTKLLDRSGRRVEPTESGQRLYRAAQRMLAVEGQLLDELAGEDGALRGELTLGASTGPGGTVVPVLLGEFQRAHPELTVALSISDTNRVIEQVAERELELGIVGASPRHRGVVFEPFFRDEVILVVPPAHRFAGKEMTLEQLREEPLILMQEGAGVRQVIEDELRRGPVRLRDLDVRLELGLQESVKSAAAAGFGVTFISRSGVEAELAAGTLATARVKGLEPAREISLVRPAGRSPSRAAEAFVEFARGKLAA